MTTWQYRPGTSTAVVSGSTAVLLDVGIGDPVVAELFDVVTADHALEDVVEVLLGLGLRRLGGFAAASLRADGIRVVVRGDFSAVAPGSDAVTGSGLWTDHTFVGASGVTLSRGEDDGPDLPIGEGTVLASAVHAGAPADATPVPGPAADQAQPEPVADGAAPIVVAAADSPAPVAADRATARPAESRPSTEPEAPAIAEPDPHADWPASGETAAVGSDEPVTVPSPLVEAAPASGLLIESFPWADAPQQPSEPPPPPPPPVPSPQASIPVDDMTAIAQRGAPDPAGFDLEAQEMTVDRSRLIEHAAARPNSVLVVAARCPSGHLSPAYADGCRVCHQPLPPQQPVEVARPPLGVLRLSNGDTVALDRGAILGRSPRLPAGYAGEQPNLVRLPDPGKDISSQHLEVTLDYWHVLVTDLGSTNGTEVILPGQPPLQLRANDPMTIEPGTRVVLAGVLDFVFEVTG